MNFNALVGAILIGFGLFLFFGDPTHLDWPAQLGPWAVKFMKFCADFRPYSAVISLVLGLASFLTMK